MVGSIGAANAQLSPAPQAGVTATAPVYGTALSTPELTKPTPHAQRNPKTITDFAAFWLVSGVGLAAALLALFALVRGWIEARALRDQLEQLLKERNTIAPDAPAPPHAGESADVAGANAAVAIRAPGPVVPNIPSELSEAIATGQAVLFAGNGIASMLGMPMWPEVLRGMVSLVTSRDATGATSQLYEDAFARDDLETVKQLLAQDLSDSQRLTAISEAFGGSGRDIPPVLGLLAQMPFSYVITPLLDDSLERAFRAQRPAIVVTADGERLNEALRYGELSIVKLFGDLRDTPTIRFTIDDYRSCLADNPIFAKTISSLALTRSVFYLGASVEEILQFLSESTLRQLPDRPHYALVQRTADQGAAAHLLAARYGVRLLTYTPGRSDAGILGFVRTLAAQVATTRALLPAASPGKNHPEEARITRVELTNIGPFRNMAFDLNPHWNVVLGINGAGKSTVLKAIALCLCADDPAATTAAEYILNNEADRGAIVLTIGGATYRSELTRERGRVRVTANRLTPLQRGSALALGFPALRAPSDSNPRGPAQTERQWPETQDLLPLLRPTADRRLGTFKQWIVNLDARSASATDPAKRAKYQHALDVAFRAVRELSGNATVRFARVDKDSWRVLLSTPDVDELSLDLVSQGMTSLLAWIGVTLERFAEINPDYDRPEEGPGIVLIDEIDAHLHPSWQRELVGVLRGIFPNAQIIATTHSPLIVGGMQSDEVFVARRDRKNPKLVEFEPLTLKFKGLRVDQVLATAAFDMPSSRDPESADILHEYEALVYKTNRNRAEDERLRKLAESLDPFFYSGVTAEQIAAEQSELSMIDDPESLVNRHLAGALSAEEREAILSALAEQDGVAQ